MARKRAASSDEPGEDPGKYSVIIDPDLVPRLKMVAAALGISGPNYVNTRLAKVINTELEAAIEEMGLGSKSKK